MLYLIQTKFRHMKHIFLLTVLLILVSFSLLAQLESKEIWQVVEPAENTSKQTEQYLQVKTSSHWKLDIETLKMKLAKAPLIHSVPSTLTLSLPLPNGQQESFTISYAPVMSSKLAEKYPSIRSYIGKGIEDPTAIVRFDISPNGLHAMIVSGKHPQVLINPYTVDNESYYQSFYKTEVSTSQYEPFNCSYTPMKDEVPPTKLGGLQKSNDCIYRTYRLALACTSEYAEFHGGNIPDVLAAMNTTMTRVNGILERDLNITLVLVADNDQLIFTDRDTDPYTNGSGAAMLDQNQTTCDDIIGSANYDIGHVFSTGGGGVAYLSSLCKSYKAGGVSGQTHPVGDPFDVDYVIHEIGHQLGANHTQNNDCNRYTNAAVEPGSASTIMGYAGICAPNIQSNSDAYFHAYSIQEITTYLNSNTGSSCAQEMDNGNSRPYISTMINYTIPASTPFVLSADATDSNGDGLTYCWEQMDKEIVSMPPQPGNTVGPSFRSKVPSYSPERYFPNMEAILQNESPSWEVLSAVSRSLNFCLTVRDNFVVGGCIEQTAIQLQVIDTGQPFQLTYPNDSMAWTVQEIEPITWEVAATDQEPINTTTVDILLSLDGGHSYPIVLAENTPNDGIQLIEVPMFISDSIRIMIKGHGNVFFDISDENLTIREPQGLSLDIGTTPLNCAGEAAVTASAFGGTAPYAYEWSTGSEQPNLSVDSPGLYSLTVTDSEGQTMSEQVRIDTLKAIEVAFSTTNISCNEEYSGHILAAPTGGQAPYQLNWSGPAAFNSNAVELNKLAGGTYQLTITDNRGCELVSAITLSDPNTSFYYDADGDGYGDEHKKLHVCYSPKGYVKVAGDCDDNDSHRNPGVKDLCDGIDNNCDGEIDEGFDRVLYYEDLDGDGFGNAAVSVLACMLPANYTTNDTDCDDLDPEVYPMAPEICDGVDNDCNGLIDEGGCRLVMEHGNLKRVGTDWQRVYLQNTYESMVVIANIIMDAPSEKPAVTRIRSAEGNSFEIKLQNPNNDSIEGYGVTFTVVEEGTYTEAEHGINLEAKKVLATATSSSAEWRYEMRTYENTYTTPVVIGQVMSYNDEDWSVFWASANGNRALPPTAAEFSASKHVGEDSNGERADEVIGYIVIEAGSYFVEGKHFYAGVGEDIVRGVNNTSSGYAYETNLSNLECAVMSMATMKGLDGGFPVLFSDSPFADQAILIAIDEDQLADDERSHSAEQVSFLAFAGPQPGPIYCEASSNTAEYEWIESISLGDITNESGNNDGYASFTDMEVVANRGSAVLYSLMPGAAGSPYPEYWTIWIDYNQDGDFEDENETVLALDSHLGMYTGQFIIPETANPGLTRIRVAMKWGSASDFCGTSGWGEIEDYSLRIGQEIEARELTAGGIENTIGFSADIELLLYPNPTINQLTVKWDGAKEGVQTLKIISGTGRTVYQQENIYENQNSIHLDVSVLPTGSYTLLLMKKSGESRSKPFIKLPR